MESCDAEFVNKRWSLVADIKFTIGIIYNACAYCVYIYIYILPTVCSVCRVDETLLS